MALIVARAAGAEGVGWLKTCDGARSWGARLRWWAQPIDMRERKQQGMGRQAEKLCRGKPSKERRGQGEHRVAGGARMCGSGARV